MPSLEAEVSETSEQRLGMKRPVALLFLKPFFVHRENIRETLEEGCKERNLQIIKEGDFQFDRETAAEFYKHIGGRPYAATYTRYMSLPERPVHWYVVIPGDELVADFYGEVRKVVKQLRDEFGRKRPDLPPRKGVNVIHGSDSSEGAEKDLRILGIELEKVDHFR